MIDQHYRPQLAYYMGAAESQIDEQIRKDWREGVSDQHLTLWESRQRPQEQLEQYSVHGQNGEIAQRLYRLRRNSPCLVNAYALASDSPACASDETTKVFIERVPLRLSNVEDVPFPDSVHLLEACLSGFAALSEVVGFFPLDEDMVGINEEGRVRVWLNPAFESNTVTGNRRISEQEMLENLLSIVYNSIDHDSFPRGVPDVLEYIGFPDNHTTFDDVRNKFNTYVRVYNRGLVPLRLTCLDTAGGAERVNEWCRRNSSFGFEQSSMRLSERVLRQSNRVSNDVAPVQENVEKVEIVEPARPFGTPDLPLYYNPSRTNIPQAQPLPQPIQQTIINPIPLQQQFQVAREFFPPTPVIPQPAALPTPPSNVSSTVQILQKQSSRQYIPTEPAPQTESRLQQQRVISQTIEVREHSKGSESNNPSVQQSQTQILRPSQTSIPIPDQTQITTYKTETLPTKNDQSPSPPPDDGRSSSDILALLSKFKSDSNEVYSQVSGTPNSVIKQQSSSSSRKYFNHQNFQETYSQQAFSSYGQDSHKVLEAFTFNQEGEGDKYAGQYNFTKYEREIDPEIQADLMRYR